jgi:hypothetical protein
VKIDANGDLPDIGSIRHVVAHIEVEVRGSTGGADDDAGHAGSTTPRLAVPAHTPHRDIIKEIASKNLYGGGTVRGVDTHSPTLPVAAALG